MSDESAAVFVPGSDVRVMLRRIGKASTRLVLSPVEVSALAPHKVTLIAAGLDHAGAVLGASPLQIDDEPSI